MCVRRQRFGDIDLRRLPDNPSPPDVWQERAACFGVDPDVFFPTTEEEASPALAHCTGCGIREECLAWALKNGERATLDHAYRVCAQCHFSQAEAWAGGAHSKRLDGWLGRRVVMGCADCHDPHRPAIESRIPFRAPQLKRPPFRRP